MVWCRRTTLFHRTLTSVGPSPRPCGSSRCCAATTTQLSCQLASEIARLDNTEPQAPAPAPAPARAPLRGHQKGRVNGTQQTKRCRAWACRGRVSRPPREPSDAVAMFSSEDGCFRPPVTCDACHMPSRGVGGGARGHLGSSLRRVGPGAYRPEGAEGEEEELRLRMGRAAARVSSKQYAWPLHGA